MTLIAAAIPAMTIAAPPARGANPSLDPCSVAVADRVGGWTCPAQLTLADANAIRKAANKPVGNAGSAAAPDMAQTATNGFCNSHNVCRQRYDAYHSDLTMKVYWGCGSDLLGLVDMYENFQMTGGQTVTKPSYYTNSVDTNNVVLEGQLYRGAAGSDGVLIDGTPAHYGPVSYVPWAKTIYWNPNGYKSYNTNYWHHSQKSEKVWADDTSKCTGNWYMYAFSEVANADSSKTVWKYGDVTSLIKSPDGSGYY